MLKRNVSIFFTLLFLATIITPSIVIAIDDSIDISLLIDISEEEEEKGNEKNKELEVFVVDSNLVAEDISSKSNQENLGYCYKNYPKPDLNLIFPPPEA